MNKIRTVNLAVNFCCVENKIIIYIKKCYYGVFVSDKSYHFQNFQNYYSLMIIYNDLVYLNVIY